MYVVCLLFYYCLITCDVGLSVETDSVQKMLAVLLLELLQELVHFILHVDRALDLQRWSITHVK